MRKPLENILVVDFSQALAGPYCTLLMADNGARIIKIERPGSGDMLRDAEPMNSKKESLFFASGNRGKESIALDLTLDDNKDFIWKIIEKADILVENFRPGVMKKLGFSYEEVKKINPAIIYTSISGFGQTGPMSHEPGFDLVGQGYSGIMSVNGEASQDSERIGIVIGDISAGMWGYMATMTALYAKEKTGNGAHVDISMLDSLFAILPPQVANYMNEGIISTPSGNCDPVGAPFGVVPVKDGQIIVAILGNKLWGEYCKVIGKPDLEEDKCFYSNELRVKNRTELRKITRPIMKTKTVDEWIKLLKSAGIPCGIVNNIKDACNMKQIKSRNMLCRAGKYTLAGNPMKISGYEDPYEKGSIPDLGEHTEKILKEFT